MKKAKGKIYIHYGATEFDPTHSLTKQRDDKPAGFWASPIHAGYGWKKWCKLEDFHTERLNTSFKFQLQNNARILKVNRLEDIEPYIIRERIQSISDPSYFYNNVKLNHEKLMAEFDGMEVTMSNDYLSFRNSYLFWSWDVDSLVIWNMNKVMPIRQTK